MSLFKSPDAVYSFDERDTVIPVELMVSLSIYRILLEGVRHMTNGKLLLAGLPPLNTMVRVAERPPFTIDPRKLKPIEQSVLRSAGKGAPLSVLLERGDAERGLVLRACYGLYAAGLLELADQNERRPLKVQEETGVFVLSEIQRKFAKIQATNAQQEILMEFDRLDRASEKELLHLEGPAQESAIQKAFEDRQSEWKKSERWWKRSRRSSPKSTSFRSACKKPTSACSNSARLPTSRPSPIPLQCRCSRHRPNSNCPR